MAEVGKLNDAALKRKERLKAMRSRPSNKVPEPPEKRQNLDEDEKLPK